MRDHRIIDVGLRSARAANPTYVLGDAARIAIDLGQVCLTQLERA
jgi:hypothetical protein